MNARQILLILSIMMGFGLPGCGSTAPGSEGTDCKQDIDCNTTLICYLGTCRFPDCPDLDCPDGWACISNLCCNEDRCCGVEGPSAAGTCDNGLDDDCDGWTDAEDDGCGGAGCSGDAECLDTDPCTVDRCVDGACRHDPPGGECCLGDGTFAAGQSVPAADDGVFISMADFDGDSHLDVAMGTDNEFGVVILPGRGDSSFRTKQLILVGSQPWATVAGRFTGGTLPDIAVADVAEQKIYLLKNQSTSGNVAFTVARSFTVGGKPYGIAAADFDQSGTLDLAVANQGANQVNVVLLNADGTPAGSGAYPTAAAPYWVAAADFNDDSKPDLATAGGSTVSVLLNQGAGQFGAKLDLSIGGDNRHLLAVDLNKDRKIDLVVPGYTDASIHVLLGNGDGTFKPEHAFSLVVGSCPDWTAAGDFNADGALDLVAIQYATNTVSFLTGVGDGFFGAPMDYPTLNRPNSVAVGDFNEDTILDLVTCDGGSDMITIFLGRGVCQ